MSPLIPPAPRCPLCGDGRTALERQQMEASAPPPGGGPPRLFWVRFFACPGCGHRWVTAALSPGR